MRISHSSSLFLATLAISSSSSTLAAPTESGSLDTTALSSSSSIRSLAMIGREQSMSVDLGGGRGSNGAPIPEANVHVSHQRRDLSALLDALAGLPVVGGVLKPILDILGPLLGKGGASAEDVQEITTAQVQELAHMLGNAAKTLQGTAANTVNSAVDGVSDGSPAVIKRYMQGTASSSAFFTSQSSVSPASSTMEAATSVEAMAFPTPSSLPITPPTSKNGTASFSPSIPVPPNTPVSPPAPPKAPLPAGVSPPSAPIARDAPPMFPAYKAADVSSSSSAYASETSASSGSASGSTTGSPTMTSSQSSFVVSGSATVSASATSA